MAGRKKVFKNKTQIFYEENYERFILYEEHANEQLLDFSAWCRLAVQTFLKHKPRSFLIEERKEWTTIKQVNVFVDQRMKLNWKNDWCKLASNRRQLERYAKKNNPPMALLYRSACKWFYDAQLKSTEKIKQGESQNG